MGKIFGRNKDVLTNICLYTESGKLVSPIDAVVGMLAYHMMRSANGGANELEQVRNGGTAQITAPGKVPLNKGQYGICCIINGEAYMIGGVSREKGNDAGTMYTLGRQYKGYQADSVAMQNDEYAQFHRYYFRILEVIYGIPADAKDHYDQIVWAHEQWTGQPLVRDQTLGDDNGWHGVIAQDPDYQTGPGYGMDFNGIDQRGGKSFKNYSLWKHLTPDGVHNINNATIINLSKTKQFIGDFYRKTPGVIENVNDATMSYVQLFTECALEISMECVQLVSHGEYGEDKEDGIYAMLESLGYDREKVEAAMEALCYTDGGKGDDSKDKSGSRYGADSSSDKPGSKFTSKPKSPDKPKSNGADDDDDYVPMPKITEGRKMDVATIEGIIELAKKDAKEEKSGDKKAALLTAAMALEEAVAEAKKGKLTEIGTPYLNRRLEDAEVLSRDRKQKVKLSNGKSICFSEKGGK